MQRCRLIREIQREFWCWRNFVESVTQKKESGLKKIMTQVMTNEPHVQGPMVQFLCPASAVRSGSSLPRLSHALRMAIYCYRFPWWMDGPLLRFKVSPTTPRLLHTKQICRGKGEYDHRTINRNNQEKYLGLGSSPDMFFLRSSTQRTECATVTKPPIQ
jgi:hypothetical protein